MRADPVLTQEAALRTEAADWFVRLQSPHATADDWRAFEQWLAHDSRAQPAFEAIEAVWVDLDRPKSVAALPRRVAGVPRGLLPSWPVVALAAGLGALVIGLGLQLAPRPHPSPGPRDPANQYARRDLIVPDRGVIRPHGGAQVALKRDGQGWLATLSRGEIEVSVRHDPARPIAILAEGERIVDVGTVFEVRQDTRGLRLSVSEGEVEVIDREPGWNALRVRSGQVLVRPPGVSGARILSPGGAPQSLSYSNASISRVVKDLNRFYSRPMRVAPGAENIRFTGVIYLADQDATIDRLAAFNDLVVSRSAAGLTLHRGRLPGA